MASLSELKRQQMASGAAGSTESAVSRPRTLSELMGARSTPSLINNATALAQKRQTSLNAAAVEDAKVARTQYMSGLLDDRMKQIGMDAVYKPEFNQQYISGLVDKDIAKRLQNEVAAENMIINRMASTTTDSGIPVGSIVNGITALYGTPARYALAEHEAEMAQRQQAYMENWKQTAPIPYASDKIHENMMRNALFNPQPDPAEVAQYNEQKAALKAAADAEQTKVMSPANQLISMWTTSNDNPFVAAFNYYVNYLSQSRAQMAYEQFTAAETEAQKQEVIKQMQEWAKEHPWAASGASIGTSLLSGADYLTDVVETAVTGNARPGSTPGLSGTTQALRGGVAENMGNTGQFLYHTGMSAADSVIAGVMGGSTGGAVLLGLGAASNAANDIKARGGTDQQALIGGAVAGVLEGAFEKLSIGQLNAMKQLPGVTIKVLLGNVAKSVVTNASEEAATELGNIIFDTVFMGELSEYTTAVKNYMEQGMNEESAKTLAMAALRQRVGSAALSGALMGIFFGAGSSAISAASEYAANHKTYNVKNFNSLVKYAMSFPEDTASYQMASQLQGEKNVTGADEVALIRTIAQDIEQGKNKAESAPQSVSGKVGAPGGVAPVTAPAASQTAQETEARDPMKVLVNAAQGKQETTQQTESEVSEPNTKESAQTMRTKLTEKLENGEITGEQYDAALESIEELESLTSEEGASLDTYNPHMMKKTEVDTDGRGNVSDDGSEWAASQSAGEQARQLAEGAGRDQSGQVQNQRAASRRDDIARYYESAGQQAVNAKEYLGSDKVNKVSTLQEVPAEMIAADSELKSIAEDIRSMGLTPHIFVGDVRLQNGNSMDGLIRDNDVFIRADSDAFTAMQNWEHEKAHAIFRQSPGIETELYKKIVGKGEAARRKLHQTIKKYRDAYHGIYDVDENGNEIWNDEVQEKILQEILADAYAGKDTFAQGVEEYADIARDAASQIESRGGEVRGPPEGRLSIKRTRTMTWKEQIRRYTSTDDTEKLKSSDSFYLGTSGKLGAVDQAPLYVPLSIATKAKRLPKGSRSAHALIDEDLASLQEGINKSPAVIHNPARNALVYISGVPSHDGQIVVVSFDLNNDLFGENAHKATSIHPRESIEGLLKNLPKEATIYVRDETKLNDMLPGMGIHSPELLATVELMTQSLADTGRHVNEYFSTGGIGSNAEGLVSVELAKEHNELAVNHFGRTFKWAETGYILLDGRKLDFSGRHEGASGGYRTVDHRDIRDALGDDYGGDSYSGGMVQFMAEGNIRIEPESGGINLSVKPTKAQLDALSDFISRNRGEVILDLDDVIGNTLSSTEYPKGTHANKVLQDIKNWFENGEEPHVSELAQFRFSAGKAAQKNGADPIEAMPTKARKVMERAEKKLQRSLSDVLNLPKMPDGVMDEVSREISREFLETGTVSDETIDRTFEKVYSAIEDQVDEQYGVDAEDRRKWAERDYIAEIGKHLAEMRLVKRYAAEKASQSKQKEQDKALTVNDLPRLYKEKKAAQRAADKAVARNLLTEGDEQKVHALLRGDIELSMLRPGVDNVRGITEVYEAKLEQEKVARQIRRWNAQRKENLRNLADELLATASDWKDKKSGWMYSRETMERNFFDIIPNKEVAKRVVDTLIKPIREGAAAATKMKNDYRKRVNKLNLSRKVAEGNTISEAAAVQLLGEAEDNIKHLQDNPFLTERDGRSLEDWQGIVRDMWEQNPNLDAGKIRNAVNEFRNVYDELFEQMNEVRMRNGYEPVNYRKGYFPHFQNTEGDNILAKFGKSLGINTAAMQLPTTINGITHNFKPGIQWFGSAQQRQGVNTVFDAVEGFDSYIEGVADVIHQTDNVQRLRAFAAQVRYRTSDEGIRQRVDAIRNDPTIAEEDKNNRIEKIYAEGKFELGNLAVELDEYTNLLAGKKSRHDRDMEQRMGRKMYAVMKWAEKQIGANMVAVNPASWLTNFIPIQQGYAMLSTRDLLSGMLDTVRSYKQDDGFVAASTFLTNRRGSDPLVKTWIEQTSGTLSKPMEWIDAFTADTLVRSRYNENIRRGLSEEAAMADADAFAASVMADRSKGAMPTIFSQTNPLTKLFTQFQLEVNNQLSFVFKDMPRETRKKGLAALALAMFKFALGGWLYNELYEWLIGRRPALDPINMVSETVSDIGAHGVYTAGVNLAGSVAEELPFIGGLLGGGRLPISSALPDLDNLWGAFTNSDWAPEKRVSTGVKELLKPALYLGMPFGGGQVKKVVEGVSTVAKGGSYSVDREGNDILQYPVYNSTPGEAGINAVRAMFFGKSSLPAAREWVDSEFDSLGAKQTELYDEMRENGASGRDVFEMIRNVENADTKMSKLHEIASTNFDEPLKELAMINYMSMSQYKKYMAARAAGVSTADYVSLLDAIKVEADKQKHDRNDGKPTTSEVESELWSSDLSPTERRAIWDDSYKLSEQYNSLMEKYEAEADIGSGSISRSVLKNVLRTSNLTNAQKRAIWESYGWSDSPW